MGEAEELRVMLDYIVVPTDQIKIKEGLPRLRQELGDIKAFTESLKKHGQLQPILCNRQMELIAGGRRLTACIDAEMDVKVVFTDTTDPIIMREMELEENVQRKPLTAAEEIMAISELHELKRKIYGGAEQGKEGGWTAEQTANIVGKSRSSIVETLQLAEALKDFPTLAACSTKSDIKRAVKGMQRIKDATAALDKYEELQKKAKDMYQLHNVDCLEFMKTLPDNSIDVLFTDPPYGVDIHDVTIGLGGHTGGDITTSGIKYDDSFEASMAKVSEMAAESIRFVKPSGFAFVFCAISYFWLVRTMFETAGWDCSNRPIIWIKNESGQNNAPDKWMSAAYECMLFARRIDSKILIEGKVDWIQHPNVVPSLRIHQAEKPVYVIKEMLSRVTLPGSVVFDPFAGSGSTIKAALELKMHPIGCENNLEAYAVAIQSLETYLAQKGEV